MQPSPKGQEPALGNRIRFAASGELEVLSPLHVGTGEARQLKGKRPPGNDSSEGEDWPEVSGVVRDADNRPFLPGTTLKGLLRRIAESRLLPDGVKSLCGEIKDDNTGAMGAILVRGAVLTAAGDAASMPYVKLAGDELGPGVFVAARTSISDSTGTAEHNRLFFQEMVAPGACFGFSLVLETRRFEKEDDAAFKHRGMDLLGHLATVLHALTEPGGWAVGKGQADGQGRVKLRPGVKATAMSIDPGTGEISYRPVTLPAPAPKPDNTPRSWTTTLHCVGPFLIADSSHRRKTEGQERAEPQDARRAAERDDPAEAQLSAQRSGIDLPLMPGTSVMGALRARAEWLRAVAAHRANPNGTTTAEPLVRAVRDLSDAANLDPVQRLFGETGFRGLLSLEPPRVSRAKRWTVTSVKLDRFSGAPFDQALFASAAFVGVDLTVTVSPWPGEARTRKTPSRPRKGMLRRPRR